VVPVLIVTEGIVRGAERKVLGRLRFRHSQLNAELSAQDYLEAVAVKYVSEAAWNAT
jgi:hypothetical protein